MENETFITIITSSSTLVSAGLSAFLTNYFNNKSHKNSDEKMMVNDIKRFAQYSVNQARECKGKESCHSLIRITRGLPEYQAYFKALNLNKFENTKDSSDTLKKVNKIVGEYRRKYRKQLIGNKNKIDENDVTNLQNGFLYIIYELDNINK